MVGMDIIEKKDKLSWQYVCIFIDIPEEIMRQRILSRQPDMNAIELQHRLDSADMERSIAKRLKNCMILDGSGSIEEVFVIMKQIIENVE